jgi:glutathione reductase (NADPH)
MTETFDVVILGTGNAGMAAAGALRAAGKSVAMVESWDVGGTCPLRGCVPKKVLVAAAQALHQIALAPAHHIAVGEVKLDWAGLIARERGFVEGVPEAFAKSLEGRGIELVRGRARFLGPDRVEVGDRVLEADKIVIATGSKPRPLDIAGAEHLITSEDILEMAELPERLVFIGGGVIALEFAHVFARAGVEVTILEALPRLLPRLDPDAVAKLHAESERIGIAVATGVEVEDVAQVDGALEVRFVHEGAQKTVLADRVANGTGRVPDFDGLDLTAGGIDHEGTRIAVDAHLRSVSNGRVYVAGDALWSSAQLSPLASYEGRVVAENIMNGDTASPDYDTVPSAVFAVPALASVGLTEAEARDRGLGFAVKANDLTGWRSSMTHAESAAFSKVLIEEGTDRILGAHILGHGAEEIVHLFAFAMKQGVGARGLGALVTAYPTFAADIKHML